MNPSNDYAAVTCSNNNQAQLHTHVSVSYRSPDVWLGLELLWDIQLGLPAILNNSLASYQPVTTIITCVTIALIYRKWAWQFKIFGCASCAHGWTPLSKFLDLSLWSTFYLPCWGWYRYSSYFNFVTQCTKSKVMMTDNKGLVQHHWLQTQVLVKFSLYTGRWIP